MRWLGLSAKRCYNLNLFQQYDSKAEAEKVFKRQLSEVQAAKSRSAH